MTKFFHAAAIAAALIASPAKAETIAISGFLGASPGICSIVATDTCTSYLAIAGTAERICASKPRAPVKIIGHSMGGSGAMDLLHRLAACGVKVSRVVALDPQAHPYDIPDGTKVLAIYSSVYAGIGEGQKGAVFVGGGHIGLASRDDVRAIARSFMAGG